MIKNLTRFLLILLFFACKEKSNTTNGQQFNLRNDTTEIENFTKELYKWNETKNSHNDFSPLENKKTDSIYTNLDLILHKERIQELQNTKLFALQFIENYDKIGLTIHEKMQAKTLQWHIGDLPPFGNGANPWCNCQDNPDEYWKKIKIKNLIIHKQTATYNWTWGDDFNYKAQAIKENGDWKISYLEGFDFNKFIPKNQ